MAVGRLSSVVGSAPGGLEPPEARIVLLLAEAAQVFVDDPDFNGEDDTEAYRVGVAWLRAVAKMMGH